MELLDDKMRVWLESAKFVKAIPGVYVLYNRSKEPIFIGETNNLEKHLLNIWIQSLKETNV